MRTFIFVLGLTALAACKESTTSVPPTPSMVTPTSSAGAVPSTPPLFTYVEGGDELAFWPPTTLRLLRTGSAPRTCMSQLSTGKDNMWTGPDVESAFADADVRTALARGTTQSFLPELDDGGVMTESLLRTTGPSLEWKLKPCHWCVAPPAGITRLHQVMAGVMLNRRLLCP
jgi:hypothetical protein